MLSSHWRVGLIAGAALLAVPALSQAAGRTYAIAIRQMAFGPAPAGLRVGDTIEWSNDDLFLHSATAKDGSFDVTLKPRSRVRVTLTKPGTIAFACRYHPGMTGRLIVAK